MTFRKVPIAHRGKVAPQMVLDRGSPEVVHADGVVHAAQPRRGRPHAAPRTGADALRPGRGLRRTSGEKAAPRSPAAASGLPVPPGGDGAVSGPALAGFGVARTGVTATVPLPGRLPGRPAFGAGERTTQFVTDLLTHDRAA
ncbi:hypothetical protein [Streptomyces sp. NPDC001056]